MATISSKKQRGGFGKGGPRRNENNRTYAYPLPLLIIEPHQPSRLSTHRILGLFGISSARIENPHCEGILDSATRSVWITSTNDSAILWRRGFFGKGDLSRSEPSWHTRQINARNAARLHLTSEEIREKRRAERRQFKIDRAKAIAQAAAEAEAAFAEGREAAVVAVPSGATWKSQQPSLPDTLAPESLEEGEAVIEEPLEDVEHLQLTLQEAFFLIWNFDCLTVLDPTTHAPLDLKSLWHVFRCAHEPPLVNDCIHKDRFDHPFLVHYIAYHYYKSLGWVVKGGIKFCVDYLLYKRGPVFAHAEFAVVVVPVYEDPADKETSPFNLNNAEPFSWSWLSTINRVNSQVQKTLILTYVIIPARSRVSPDILVSPACLAHYSVREVVLKRFVPARMRD